MQLNITVRYNKIYLKIPLFIFLLIGKICNLRHGRKKLNAILIFKQQFKGFHGNKDYHGKHIINDLKL